jgi:predicted porin
VGGAYDFGSDFAGVRPSLSYTQTKYLGREQKIWTASVTAPLGQGQLWGAYTDAKANGAAETAVTGYTPIGDAKLFAAGYIYNLSKRTALYTTVSQIKNDGAAKFIVNGAPAATAGGQKSSGVDVGVRHSF